MYEIIPITSHEIKTAITMGKSPINPKTIGTINEKYEINIKVKRANFKAGP